MVRVLFLVVATEVEDRIVINQRHAKLPEPALPAEHIAVNLNSCWEENDRIEFPFETGDRHFMAEGLKLTGSGSKTGWLACLYVDPQLLPICAFEDTVIGPGIELGEKAHRLWA